MPDQLYNVGFDSTDDDGTMRDYRAI